MTLYNDKKELVPSLAESGLSVIPVRAGTKVAHLLEGQRKKYEEQIASKEEINAWIERGDSFAVLCGAVSGNLECFDVDEKHKQGLFEKWKNLLSDGAKTILSTLPIDTTINDGFHVLYRCDEVEGSKKLAQKEVISETEKPEVETLLETRGTGGYFLVPPSGGYVTIQGSLLDIPRISPEVRKEFLSCARALNEYVPSRDYIKAGTINSSASSLKNGEKERPGDYFNKTARWEDILTPHGWILLYESGEMGYWKRPNKKGGGVSATTGFRGRESSGDYLYVFSTSTILEAQKAYDKFSAYTFLNHGGDFRNAAREIAEQNPEIFPKEAREDTQTSLTDKNEEGTIMVRLSDVRKERVRWLWKNRIALGKLCLIAGDPGVSKSLLTLTIAAHVSNGRSWFIDESECPQGDVIILSAEDDAADTLVPRLEAAGANLSRIHSLEMVRVPTKDGMTERVFSVKRDLPVLKEALDKNPETKLIIIDPVSSFLDGTDSHANADVRGLISPLSKLASAYKVAVVMVSHLNKNSGETNALYRATGSLAFVAVARTAFLVVKDGENKERRLMLELKNNIAKNSLGIAWRIKETEDEIPYIVCENGFVSISAEEALSASSSVDDSQESEEVAFLKEELKDGEKGAAEIIRNAKKIGITDHPLRDARNKLGIVLRKKGYGGGWMWSLPVVGVVPEKDVIFDGSVTFEQNKDALGIPPQQLLLPPPTKTPLKVEDDIDF